jgi:cytochrome P450 family 6
MSVTVISKGENLIKTLERKSKHGATVETKDVANRFTVDIISAVAFGMESNTLNDEHKELIGIFKEIFGAEGPSLLYFAFLLSFPNLSKKLRLRQFSKNVEDFFINVVAGNISYREKNNEKRNDFLDMLIQLKNKGSIDGEFSSETKKLTLNECLAQAFIFFFAGADTSSTAISFALTELAFNQDLQEKLRQEILDKTKDSNGELTYDNINEMTYLNQVVNGK